MTKYKVYVEETRTKSVVITAENKDQAYEIGTQRYYDGKISAADGDLVETNIAVAENGELGGWITIAP